MDSDHRAVLTSVSINSYNIDNKTVKSRTTWNFKKARWAKYKKDIDEELQNTTFKNSCKEELQFLTNNIIKSAKCNIPRGKM